MKSLLSITPLEDALQLFFETLNPAPTQETILTVDALGRTTVTAIRALADSPAYDSCAMDGIAVMSQHTQEATTDTPMVLTLGEDCARVNTGNVLPTPYDAVIMIEEVTFNAAGQAVITRPATAGQHVRGQGEDIQVGDPILAEGHTITALDLGALLSAGIAQLAVYRQPVVGIVSTGSELVDVSQFDPNIAGQVVESNSHMLAGLIQSKGLTAVRYPKLADDLDRIKDRLSEAAQHCDVILISAGTSAGTHDYTAQAIRDLGQVLVHGLAIKPGKPAILGRIGQTAVIGLPGYPVSTYVVYTAVVGPWLERLYPVGVGDKLNVQATLSRTLVSSFKQQEYVRVGLSRDETGQWVATPLPKQVGTTMSLANSHGFVIIPQLTEGIAAGDRVDVVLHRPLD